MTDFGLSVAKQETEVATGASLGSPQWTAPELLRGKAADECADIYSYGLLVYEVKSERSHPYPNSSRSNQHPFSRHLRSSPARCRTRAS